MKTHVYEQVYSYVYKINTMEYYNSKNKCTIINRNKISKRYIQYDSIYVIFYGQNDTLLKKTHDYHIREKSERMINTDSEIQNFRIVAPASSKPRGG